MWGSNKKNMHEEGDMVTVNMHYNTMCVIVSIQFH